MEGIFIQFFSNKITLAVLLASLFSQILKTFYWSIKKRRLFPEALYRGYGGFPSSHTAFVTSLTGSIYMLEGLSNLFFVTFGMSLLWVIYVLDIKMFFELTSEYLDDVFDTVTNIGDIKKLESLMGHTFSQVIGGFIVGILAVRYIFF